MEKNTNTQIAERIREAYNKNEWNFEEVHEENGDIVFINKFRLGNTLGNIRNIVIIEGNRVTAHCYMHQKATEHLAEVGEFLHRINNGVLSRSRFELDYDDGCIESYYMQLIKNIRDDEDLDLFACLVTDCFNDFGDDIMTVMLGLKSPKEAAEEAIAKFKADKQDDSEKGEN